MPIDKMGIALEERFFVPLEVEKNNFSFMDTC